MPPSLSAICTLTGSYGRAASRVYDGILPRRYGLDNPLSQRPTRNRLEASRASRTRGGRFSRFTRGNVRRDLLLPPSLGRSHPGSLLIRILSRNNSTWGAPRIHSEPPKLGIRISEAS